MKKGKWTKEDEKELKMACQLFTKKELAEIFERSYNSIDSKLRKMGLNNKVILEKPLKRWTKEEIELLKNIIHLYTLDELAEFFGVTKDSIYFQIKEHKLMQKEQIKIPEGYKKCSKCKEMLKKDFFYKHSSTKFGLQSYCKECEKSYRAERMIKKKLSLEKEQLKLFIQENQDKFFKCRVCDVEKAFDGFHIIQKEKIRLSTECKKCHNERAKRNGIKRAKEKGYY